MALTEIYKGNSQDISFTIKDKAASGDDPGTVAADYLDYTVTFTLKKFADDTDANAIVQKVTTMTLPTPDVAQALLNLTESETDIAPGQYYYDYTFIEPGAVDDRGVKTLAARSLEIKPKVKD